jgi:hypothetical protein
VTDTNEQHRRRGKGHGGRGRHQIIKSCRLGAGARLSWSRARDRAVGAILGVSAPTNGVEPAKDEVENADSVAKLVAKLLDDNCE